MTFEELYEVALSKTMAAVSSAQTLRESFSDVCVEVPLGPLSHNDMVVIWGEENDNNEKFYSFSVYSTTPDGQQDKLLRKTFSADMSTEAFHQGIFDLMSMYKNLKREEYARSTAAMHEGDCGISLYGKVFTLEEVCRAMGITPGSTPDVSLCIGVKAGVLKSSLCNEDPDYPGIRTELALPPEAETVDIMLTVTEQPRSEDEHEPVRTFGYNRDDEYFLYFDADTRPDREVENDLRRPSVTVGGNPNIPADVYQENNMVRYHMSPAPEETRGKPTLSALISDAEKAKGDTGAVQPQSPTR